MRAASALARVRADIPAVIVQAGTHDLGTGAYTIMTQIAAVELGVPTSAITFELGDTKLPEAPLAAGSQTSASVGSAVKLASAQLRAELSKLAAEHGLAADAPFAEVLQKQARRSSSRGSTRRRSRSARTSRAIRSARSSSR
jgi:xanthine dehydrogenase YagR molybdenum-binding subunit